MEVRPGGSRALYGSAEGGQDRESKSDQRPLYRNRQGAVGRGPRYKCQPVDGFHQPGSGVRGRCSRVEAGERGGTLGICGGIREMDPRANQADDDEDAIPLARGGVMIREYHGTRAID